MNDFYAIDSARVSYREYWWGTKSPLVIVGWIAKWLRLRIPSSTDDPNCASTLPGQVEALPAEVMTRFQPLANELAALGFYDVAYHCLHDPGTQTTIYWATFLHESGIHFARLHQRLWGQTQRSDRGLFPMIFTEFTDGTFLVSSAGKPDLATPATVRMNRMPGAPCATLWAAHQPLAEAESAQKMPARVATPEEAVAATERHHVLLRDFNLARGVFRPRTTVEQTQAENYGAAMAQARASGFQHPEVLAELERLQENKASWGNAIWILLLSIVAFVALGAARWNWKFTLWLIPVLLFHEAGHWAAMRIFRYRNLRMFFIPLFGAAVTGRHWNVPGWKKAIVSLAGPVPGILVGAVLAVVALIVQKPWLNEGTFILLILNGFNLLPVLPLDGGHVLHATLFCRNRWLDIGFRCAAILGLLLLGLAGLGRFLIYIAVALGLGLPLAFKQGKVVDQMRQTALPPPQLDSDRIPPETAQAIISALKAEQPKGMSNKLLAQQTLAVYETLNAKPPGALATMGLLAVHGGAFFLAVVFCFLLMLGKFGGGFGNFVSTALRQPQHPVNCQEPMPSWTGNSEAESNPVRSLLVSTLDNHAQAAASFAELRRSLPATARLAQFGDSLLVSLPADDDAAREHWFTVLQTEATNTFVILSNRPVTMSLMFIAQTEAAATNLAHELEACGAVPGARLIPPWSPAARTAAYTNQLQERLLWLRLNRLAGHFWTNAAMQDINRRTTAAMRRGAAAEVTQLAAEREALLKHLETSERETIRAEFAGTPAATLVDLHAQLSAETNRTTRAALLHDVAVRLGEVPSGTNQTLHPGAAFSGSVRTTGLLVEAPWCSVGDPQHALPQLLDWLCDQHCISIKYDFHDAYFFDGFDDLSDDPE